MTGIELEFRARCAQAGERLQIHEPQFILNKGLIFLGDDVDLSGTSDILFSNIETTQPELRVGDRSFIASGCSFHIARSITIGRQCRIASGARLRDFDGHPMDAIARRTQPTPPAGIGAIRIGDDVWIGNNALVLRNVTIGDRSVVAAMSVVAGDVPPDTLVAGNPARAVRALNGRAMPAPRVPPEGAALAERVRWVVAEHARTAPADVDLKRWAGDYGIDSLQLLLLRETLEAELGVRFSDARWLSFRSFEELAVFCEGRGRMVSVPRQQAESPVIERSIPAGGELRTSFEIGMPLTGRNHLAEGPLLQFVGDLRWKQMKQISGVPSGRILDEEGEPLYATFVYIEMRFPPDRPMAAFRLDDQLQAECHLRRYGGSVLDGVTYLMSDGDGADPYDTAPRVRLTNVFARQHNGAEWLRKSRPADPRFEQIAALDEPPDSLDLVRSAAKDGRFDLPPDTFSPLAPQPIRIPYKLIPDRDLNAAGLIYFAHYPVFLDIAEREALLEAEPALEAFIDARTVVRRQSAYLNNAAAHDTLLIDVEPWICGPIDPRDDTPIALWINFRMYRKSDERLMMVSTVEKRIDSRLK